MSSAKAIAFHDELARARAIAAERKRVLAEAPELSAEQILEGFKRDLRSVYVHGFGTVFYYHPMSVAERYELEMLVDAAGETTVRNVIRGIIAFARNSDGSLKFKPEHEAALLEAPSSAVMQLASSIIEPLSFAVASAEKK